MIQAALHCLQNQALLLLLVTTAAMTAVGKNYADLVVTALVIGSVVEYVAVYEIVVAVAVASTVPQHYSCQGISNPIIVSALTLG